MSRYHELGTNSICINLNEKISRLHNRFQFAVGKAPTLNKTGIMTVGEIKVLNGIKKLIL